MKDFSTFGVSALLLSAGLGCVNAATASAGVTYAYANQVISGGSGTYTTGWNGELNSDAGTAFSGPTSGVGSGHYYLTPFEPAWVTAAPADSAYSPAVLAQVNPGSTLVLQFANGFAASTSAGLNSGFTLGIHAGVGITDTSPGATSSSTSYSGTGVAGNPATTFNSRISYLAVGDGTHWAWFAGNSLNGAGTAVTGTQWTALSSALPSASDVPTVAAEMAFNNPSAFYASTAVAPDGGNNTVTPSASTPLADPSLDFTGTLAAFNGEDYGQVMSTLNGSAGGNWFNLSTSGLGPVTQVAFVVPSGQAKMYVQAVVGDATPEPASLGLLAVGATALLLLRNGKRRLL